MRLLEVQFILRDQMERIKALFWENKGPEEWTAFLEEE